MKIIYQLFLSAILLLVSVNANTQINAVFAVNDLINLRSKGYYLKGQQDTSWRKCAIEKLSFTNDNLDDLEALLPIIRGFDLKDVFSLTIIGLEADTLPNELFKLFDKNAGIAELVFKDCKNNRLNNVLRKVDEMFVNDIQAIGFEDNGLTDIPDFVLRLKNLEVLKFEKEEGVFRTHNQKADILSRISTLPELNYLYINECKLTTFTHNSLSGFPKLQFLSLRKNLITTVEFPPFFQDNLLSLDLSFNRLESIPDALFQLCKLKYLYLDCNKLGPYLTDESNLVGLRERITEACALEGSSFKRLRNLGFSCNEIDEVLELREISSQLGAIATYRTGITHYEDGLIVDTDDCGECETYKTQVTAAQSEEDNQ